MNHNSYSSNKLSRNQNLMNFQTHIAPRFQSIVHLDNAASDQKHIVLPTDFPHNFVDNDKYLNLHRRPSNMGYIDNDE